MRAIEFISVRFTICLISGILLGHFLQPNLLMALALLGLGALLLICTWRFYKKKGFAFFETASYFTIVALGLSTMAMTLPKNSHHHYRNTDFDTIKAYRLKIKSVLKTNQYNNRYTAEVLTANDSVIGGKVLLTISKRNSRMGLTVDDELMALTKIKKVPFPGNPHQFDYSGYLAHQGVFGQVNLEEGEFLAATNAEKTWLGRAANFRHWLTEKLAKEDFGKEELGIIQALLLGQRNDISPETYKL